MDGAMGGSRGIFSPGGTATRVAGRGEVGGRGVRVENWTGETGSIGRHHKLRSCGAISLPSRRTD